MISDDLIVRLKGLGLRPMVVSMGYWECSEADILEIEQAKGYELPSDYKHFVSQYGLSHFGQLVAVRAIEKPNESVSSGSFVTLRSIYGGGTGPFSVKRLLHKRHGEEVPHSLLIIGGDGLGNQIVLDLNSDSGSVYIWDDVAGEGSNERTRNLDDWRRVKLTKISNSFTGFLEQIVPLSKCEGWF